MSFGEYLLEILKCAVWWVVAAAIIYCVIMLGLILLVVFLHWYHKDRSEAANEARKQDKNRSEVLKELTGD